MINNEIEVVMGSLLMVWMLQTKICFERIRMFSYAIWSAGVWYGIIETLLGRHEFLMWLIPRQIISINTVYCYELLFHTPDVGHIAHHVVTIILQLLSFYSGFVPISIENAVLCCSAQLGLFSSILSSARTIAKTENWNRKGLIANAYYYSYLLAKPGMIIAHYVYWYANRQTISVSGYGYVHTLYVAVHIIQLYFSWKIVQVLKFHSLKSGTRIPCHANKRPHANCSPEGDRIILTSCLKSSLKPWLVDASESAFPYDEFQARNL